MSTEKTADASSKDQPKMIKVDVLDTQYELPEDAAKELIALRDKIGKDNLAKGYNNTAAKKAKELEAKLKTLEDAEQAAKTKQAELERAALEAKAGTTGEVEKIKSWYNTELEKAKQASTSEVSKWKNSAIEDKLFAIVSKVEGIVPSAIPDVVKNLKSDYSFDIDGSSNLVAIADGKPKLADNGDPITAAQLADKFISERDWLKLHKGATGTTEKKVEQSTKNQLAGLSSEQRIELMQNGKLDPRLVTAEARKNAGR